MVKFRGGTFSDDLLRCFLSAEQEKHLIEGDNEEQWCRAKFMIRGAQVEGSGKL